MATFQDQYFSEKHDICPHCNLFQSYYMTTVDKNDRFVTSHVETKPFEITKNEKTIVYVFKCRHCFKSYSQESLNMEYYSNIYRYGDQLLFGY